MGRYVPPELEGTTSGNTLNQKRAPGTLRKDGTQTVRFEMPFAVWCHSCKPHAIIGQGVRFNAEKKKIGHYYSTPIWRFRIKHNVCGGHLEIETDPKETRYVVVSGGKARDYGDDEDKVREGEDGRPILTEREREARREDAFAALEGKVEDQIAVKETGKRIRELYSSRERDWDDPWTANKRVREGFRRERKFRKREEEATERLKERLGTEMEILPETAEDKQRAKLMSFGTAGLDDFQVESSSQSFLRTPVSARPRMKASSKSAESKRDALRRQLVGNTRASLNPFG